MRFILDITKTSGGQYQGSLTRPGTADRHNFAGVLELLAVLERQPWPSNHDDTTPADRETSSGHPLGA